MSWLSYPTRFAGCNFTLLWTHMDRLIPTSYCPCVTRARRLAASLYLAPAIRMARVSASVNFKTHWVHKPSNYPSVRDCLSFWVLTESMGDNLACHDANIIRDGPGRKHHPHPILIEMPQGPVCLTRQIWADCRTEWKLTFIAHLQTMNSVTNLVLRRRMCEFLCCRQLNFARL